MALNNVEGVRCPAGCPRTNNDWRNPWPAAAVTTILVAILWPEAVAILWAHTTRGCRRRLRWRAVARLGLRPAGAKTIEEVKKKFKTNEPMFLEDTICVLLSGKGFQRNN